MSCSKPNSTQDQPFKSVSPPTSTSRRWDPRLQRSDAALHEYQPSFTSSPSSLEGQQEKQPSPQSTNAQHNSQPSFDATPGNNQSTMTQQNPLETPALDQTPVTKSGASETEQSDSNKRKRSSPSPSTPPEGTPTEPPSLSSRAAGTEGDVENFCQDVRLLDEVEWGPRQDEEGYDSDQTLAPRPKHRITAEMCMCQEPPAGQKWTCRTDDCINYACREECRKPSCIEQCGNQRISRREFKKVQVFDAGPKGYGLRVLEDCVKGDIIEEYTGQAVQARALPKLFRRYQHERRLYIMALDDKVYLDAKKAGGLARYINHSCFPNCKVERWRVKGVYRAAVLALQKIEAGTELTFDYQWSRKIGRAPTKCHCGEPNCRGTLEISKSLEEGQIEQLVSGNWVTPKHRRADERIINRTIRVKQHREEELVDSDDEDESVQPNYVVGEISEYSHQTKLHKVLYQNLEERWENLNSSAMEWSILDQGEESPTRTQAIARKAPTTTDAVPAKFVSEGSKKAESLLTAFAADQDPMANQQYFYLYIQTPIKQTMFTQGNSLKERVERNCQVSIALKQQARPPLPCNVDDPEDVAKFAALDQSFDGTVWKISISGSDKDVQKAHSVLSKNVQYWQKKYEEDAQKPLPPNGLSQAPTINGSGSDSKMSDEVIFPRVIADYVKRKLLFLRERCRNVSIHVKASESKSKQIARLVMETSSATDLLNARTQIRNAIMNICNQELSHSSIPLSMATVLGEKIPRDFGFLGGYLTKEEFEALVINSSKLLQQGLITTQNTNKSDTAASLMRSRNSWASVDLNQSPFFTTFESRYGPIWVQSEDDMGRISNHQLVGDAKSTDKRKVYFGCDPKDVIGRWELIHKRAQEVVRGVRYLYLGTGVIYQRYMLQSHYFTFVEAMTGASVIVDQVTGNHIRIDGSAKLASTDHLPERVKTMSEAERADLAEELVRLQIEVYRDQFTRQHSWIFGRDWNTINLVNEEPVSDNMKQLVSTFGQLDGRSAPHSCVEIAEVVAHLDLPSSVAAHASIILYRFVSVVPETQMKARDAVLACIFIANKAQKVKKWRRMELVLEAGYKAFYPGTQFDGSKEEVTKLEQRVLEAEQELLDSLQYDVFVRGIDSLEQAVPQNSEFIESINAFAFGGQVLGAGAQLWLKYGIDYIFAACAAVLKADLKEIVTALNLIPLKVSQAFELIYENARYGKPNSSIVPSNPLLEGDKSRLEKYVSRIHETCVKLTGEIEITKNIGPRLQPLSPTRRRCLGVTKENLRSYIIRGVPQQVVADHVLGSVDAIEAESGCSIFLSASTAPGQDDICIQGPWRAIAIANHLLRTSEELANLPPADDVPDGGDKSVLLQVKTDAGLIDAREICTSSGWDGTIHPLGSKDHAERLLGGKSCVAGKISLSALRKSGLRWWIGKAKGSSPAGTFTEMFALRYGHGDKLASLAEVTSSMEDASEFPILSSFGEPKAKKSSGEEPADESPYVPVSLQRWPSEKVSSKEEKKLFMSKNRSMAIGFSAGALQEMQLLTLLHKLVPSPHGHPNFILPVGIAVPEDEEESPDATVAPDKDDPMFSLFKTTKENENAAIKEKKVKNSPHLVFQPCPFVLQRFLSRKKSEVDLLHAPTVLSAWFHDLLSALVHCHSNHVILRTLQPDQILLDHSGVLKLSGLYRSNVLGLDERRHPINIVALAKELKKKGTSKKKDEDDDAAISPFAPPEVLLGSTKHTKESDVWTLGCLLAYILIGKPLFAGKDRQCLLTSIYKVVGIPAQKNFEDAARFPHYTKPAKKYKRGVEKAIEYMLKSDHAPKYAKAMDLIAKMLHLDPLERITGEDALNHEFLTEYRLNVEERSFQEQFVREWMPLKEKLIKSSKYANGGASREQQLRALSMLASATGADSHDEGDGLYDFEL